MNYVVHFFESLWDTLVPSIPAFGGFLAALLLLKALNRNLLNRIFLWWATRMQKGHKLRVTGDDPAQRDLTKQEVDNPYGDTGGTIGGLERVLYIFCVVTWNLELVVAWVILKEFQDFMNKKWVGAANSTDEKSERLAWYDYHLYAGGSLISLLIGISFGLFARWIAAALAATMGVKYPGIFPVGPCC